MFAERMARYEDKPSYKLVIRVKPAIWAGILLLLAISLPLLVMAVPPSGTSAQSASAINPMRAAMLIYALIASVALLWAQRASIVADPDGLRWRSLGGWRSAPWDQIEDFYLLSDTPDSAGAVITTAGRLDGTAIFGNLPELREYISRSALNAPNRDWGMQGLRRNEVWPLEFLYDTQSNRLVPLILGLCVAIIIPAAGALVHQAITVAKSAALTWNRTLTAGTVFLISAPLVLLVYACRTAGRTLMDTRRRMSQRIIAEDWGLTYNDGDRSAGIAWQDIAEYRPPEQNSDKRSFVVKSATEQFDFTPQISNVELLQRLMLSRVPAAISAASGDPTPITAEVPLT